MLTNIPSNAEYLDHGDPIVECSECHALLWRDESMRGSKELLTDSFALCCMRGKVQLPVALKPPPPLLMKLTKNEHPKSKGFLENIRRYNSMFAFTSLGGNIDHSINNGRGPYCFRLHGENYHVFGQLLPKSNDKPKFAQLYIFDTRNEIQNRINVVRYFTRQLHIVTKHYVIFV